MLAIILLIVLVVILIALFTNIGQDADSREVTSRDVQQQTVDYLVRMNSSATITEEDFAAAQVRLQAREPQTAEDFAERDAIIEASLAAQAAFEADPANGPANFDN